MPKERLRRVPRPLVDEPSVLVLKEKHANRYFYIPDEATLFAAALAILTARKADNWYYPPGDPPADPGLTQEVVDTLPASLQADARKKLLLYREGMREHQRESEDWQEIERAISDKDGRIAWSILRQHSGGEYERVTLERFETI